MALRLSELDIPFVLLFTATGNELPPVHDHIARVVRETNCELVLPENRSLEEWIDFYNALPNWRMRWCTRQIKIEPAIAYLVANPGSTLAVGLRADEPERAGLYGEFATYRYPLREWGWDIHRVRDYCSRRGFTPPARTDCAVCPYQRLSEWFHLWRDHRAYFEQGVAWEAATGHTFRSPGRDSWPAPLAELAELFENGRIPKGEANGLLFDDDDPVACRVCRA